MDLRRWMSVGALATGCLVGAAGCSDKPSVVTSNVEATVSGTVKVDGVPVKDGELQFDPTNYQRQAEKRHTPIKDGAYTIKTLTGRNTIRITGQLAKKKALLQQQTQSFTVENGENTFDMEFTGK